MVDGGKAGVEGSDRPNPARDSNGNGMGLPDKVDARPEV